MRGRGKQRQIMARYDHQRYEETSHIKKEENISFINIPYTLRITLILEYREYYRKLR